MLHLKGNLLLRTLNEIPSLGYKPAFLFPMVGVAIQSQPQTVQAMKTDRKGRMKTAALEINGTQYSMTIGTQVFDWTTLQLLQGQVATSETTSVIEHRIYGLVPKVAPYTITDGGLPAAADDRVQVYVTERGPWGEGGLRKMVAAAPGVGEVQFTPTVTGGTPSDGILTFNAADAGAPIVYVRPTAYTSVEAIGATQSPEYFGDMEGWLYAGSESYYPDATGYDGGLQYYFPKMTRAVSSQTLDFNQSPVGGQLTYGLIAPDYQDLPYFTYNINTAVA